MNEQQDIEFKQKWHDDYLKTLVAFANTLGGELYIGKNDDGEVVGVSNTKQLLETIPQKIQNALGILSEVNLANEQEIPYIKIKVEPSDMPISLRGRYYYRSGSTTKEMTGGQLNEFLLKKSGRSWEGVEELKANMDHISSQTLDVFRVAANKIGRIPNTEDVTDIELLDKLRLFNLDGNLTRAAIILFGKDPNRFYANLKIKIGRFGKDDATLVHEDVVEGNLIDSLLKTISVLETKYLIRKISYQGVERIETGEYPSIAIRECLLNALVHRNYFNPTIHISIYDHKIIFHNQGGLPDGFSIASLKEKHASILKNPMIADVCHKAGYIESWGTGTLKIFESCREAHLPEPVFEEKDGGVFVTVYKSNEEGTLDSNQVNAQEKDFKFILNNDELKKSLDLLADVVTVNLKNNALKYFDYSDHIVEKYKLIAQGLTEIEIRVLKYTYTPKKKKEILIDCLGISNQTKNFKHHTANIIEKGLLKQTLPNKPTSRYQKYYTSEGGKICLHLLEEKK